jgi:hypothetical protein
VMNNPLHSTQPSCPMAPASPFPPCDSAFMYPGPLRWSFWGEMTAPPYS